MWNLGNGTFAVAFGEQCKGHARIDSRFGIDLAVADINDRTAAEGRLQVMQPGRVRFALRQAVPANQALEVTGQTQVLDNLLSGPLRFVGADRHADGLVQRRKNTRRDTTCRGIVISSATNRQWSLQCNLYEQSAARGTCP